jgi:hypothetical protein
MATLPKIPTPSGWTLIKTPNGWLKPEYQVQEANSTSYPSGSERYYPAEGFAYHWWTLRQDNADPTVWYLLVGRSTDLVNFDNLYVFTQKSLSVPPKPDFSLVTGSKAILIGVALGGAAIFAVMMGRRFMSKKRRGRR